MMLLFLSCVLGWFCYVVGHRSLLGCGAFGVVAVWKGKGKKGCPSSPETGIIKPQVLGTDSNTSWAGNLERLPIHSVPVT